ELRDERELVCDLLVVSRGAPPPPSLLGALFDEAREVLVLAHARRQREARQPRSERLEPERATLGHGERRGESLVVTFPPLRELRGALEVPLAVRTQPRPHL